MTCKGCEEREAARCADCREPTGPIVVCETCATARCESVAAAQRKRDAEICRQIHSTSRQRVELALLCAGEIEAATDRCATTTKQRRTWRIGCR